MTSQDEPHTPGIDIDAVYEDGVLKPDRALELPGGARLRVTVRSDVTTETQRSRIQRYVSAAARGVGSALAVTSRQILAKIDGLQVSDGVVVGTCLAAMLAGGWFLVVVLRILDLGILGDLERLWDPARAGRHFVDAHRKDLSVSLVSTGLVVAALWLYRRRRAGLQPAAFVFAVGLGLAGELMVLDQLFRVGTAA